jgi:UDP-glucose 4-epimerase
MNFIILLVGCSGYIGSYISEKFHQYGISLIGCDIELPVNPSNFKKFYQCRYQDLKSAQIKEADIIFWFAGHSSVKKANQFPLCALENNVSGLIDFLKLAGTLNIPIIYASSASVLSSDDGSLSMAASEICSNVYDASKLALDIVAPYCGANARALRLSTMSGWSPKLRTDLVFNAMNLSAKYNKIVKVQNSSNFKSILFLSDLINYLLDASISIINKTDNQRFKTVGLSSWSGTIGQLGIEIAHYWDVPIIIEGDTGTYSFVVNDVHTRSAANNNSNFYQSISKRCHDFNTKEIFYENK